MENKYNPGDVVYAKANPTIRLTVRRYVSRVYYCRLQDDSAQKELVFFERELLEKPSNPIH